MPSVNLAEAEFCGRVSTPPANREAEPPECLHCGSQLAGRYQGVRFAAEAFDVRKFIRELIAKFFLKRHTADATRMSLWRQVPK